MNVTIEIEELKKLQTTIDVLTTKVDILIKNTDIRLEWKAASGTTKLNTKYIATDIRNGDKYEVSYKFGGHYLLCNDNLIEEYTKIRNLNESILVKYKERAQRLANNRIISGETP